MGRSTALARVAKRRTSQRPAPNRLPARAFMWAWERLDGWGPLDANGGKSRDWNFAERIDFAQRLAWYAVNKPTWTAPARKRWPAIEAA